MNLLLSSKALKKCRPALEELLYFNPAQHLMREGILETIEHFGTPKVVEVGEHLSIRVGQNEVQTLFAFDGDQLGDDPIGLVIFLRTAPEEMALMHIAVHPDYALQGQRMGMGLGILLMERVQEIGRKIVGVKRIVLSYRKGLAIRL